MADEQKNPQQIIDDATNALGQTTAPVEPQPTADPPLAEPATISPPPPPLKPMKKKGGKGMMIGVLIFLILTLPVAIYYGTQQITEIRSRAATTTTYQCQLKGEGLCNEGLKPGEGNPNWTIVSNGLCGSSCHSDKQCCKITIIDAKQCEDCILQHTADPWFCNTICGTTIPTPTPKPPPIKSDEWGSCKVDGDCKSGFFCGATDQCVRTTIKCSRCPTATAESSDPCACSALCRDLKCNGATAGQMMFYCKTDTSACIQTTSSYADTATCKTFVDLYGQIPNSGTCYTTQSSCASACQNPAACPNSSAACQPGGGNYSSWLPNHIICGTCTNGTEVCGTWEGEAGVKKAECCGATCGGSYPWTFKDYCLSTNTSNREACFNSPVDCARVKPCQQPTQPPTGQKMFYCKTDTYSCIQTTDSYTDTASCVNNVNLYGQKPNSGICYTSQASCQNACQAAGAKMYICRTDNYSCIQTSENYTSVSACAANVQAYITYPNTGTCYTSQTNCQSACQPAGNFWYVCNTSTYQCTQTSNRYTSETACEAGTD